MARPLFALLITLGDPNTLSGGYLFHRRLAGLAPRHGARLEFVSVPPRTFPLGLLDAPRVGAMVRRHAPDVVVLDSIAAAFMAFWTAPGPSVGMLHQPPGGIDHGWARTLVQGALDRVAYQRLERLLVASESLAEELRRVGVPARQIQVVPPGRDVAPELSRPPSTSAPPNPPLTVDGSHADPRRGRRAAFLSVGNWLARKGTLSLLDAFAHLDPKAGTLHLVGHTAVEPKYARRVWARLARADLHGRVVVHGPLAVGQVAALYAAADVFVLPSWKEPYGTVYGEAMAYGLPVVGWRAGNLPYLADDWREGLLVEPGDVHGLSAALQRLADDEGLRQRLGAAAQVRALARPTWDRVAELFFSQLREVAGQPGVAA
ncbi:MAG TPA: glycosyltransferase family 4 protein [Chloroflexota bacterium]